MDIAAWLHGLGMQQYEEAFRDNAIDAAILPELTAEASRTSACTWSGTGAGCSLRLPPCETMSQDTLG